jgi:hypothetical protein
VADSLLHEAMCRQRPELRPTVGYMQLCVDRDLKILIVGYVKQFGDRDQKCGRRFVK